MSYIERLVHHERLMTRMADRNGADVDVALMSGALTPGDLHQATFACMGCTNAGACERRLDAGTPGLPEYCRNADMISEVKSLLHAAE